jgi:hypothetical protein
LKWIIATYETLVIYNRHCSQIVRCTSGYFLDGTGELVFVVVISDRVHLVELSWHKQRGEETKRR